MAGGMHGQGGVCGRRDGHCSGRYTSYWNAFLFNFLVTYQIITLLIKILFYSRLFWASLHDSMPFYKFPHRHDLRIWSIAPCIDAN